MNHTPCPLNCRCLLAVGALLFLSHWSPTCALANPDPPASETAAAEEARLRWWRDAKFGMFLHWSPVSLQGTELSWSRKGRKPLDVTGDPAGPTADPEYDNLYRRFDPTSFDAGQWVRIAQDAGMRYMVLTCKHHEGFAMYPTRFRPEFSIAATPFKRDVVKELADACHAAGMRFGVYYSQRDWTHPDYGIGDNRKYVDFMNGQLRELLSQYGKVDVVWFDSYGTGDLEKFWRIGETWSLVKSLQPEAVINNRLAVLASYNQQPAPYRGDFDTPEQRIGGMQSARAWESCVTLVGGQWSYKPHGEMMELARVIQGLVLCATGDGNLLLNVGPMSTGEIEPRQAARLREVGDWLRKHGESLYGTRGGPLPNGKWGGTTQRGDKVWVHVLEWPGEELRLPALEGMVKSVRVLTGGDAIVANIPGQSLLINLPKAQRDALDTVIELTMQPR